MLHNKKEAISLDYHFIFASVIIICVKGVQNDFVIKWL